MNSKMINRWEVFALNTKFPFLNIHGEAFLIFVFEVINIKKFTKQILGNDVVEITYKRIHDCSGEIETFTVLVQESLEEVTQKIGYLIQK